MSNQPSPGCNPVSSHNTAQTGNLPRAHDNMGVQHEQTTQEAHPISTSTQASTRSSYVSTIHNFHEAAVRRAACIAQNNRFDTKLEGLPTNDAERAPLVRKIWDAILNLEEIIESEKSLNRKYIASEDHYTNEEIDINCWILLGCIENAQRGFCHLTPWYTTSGPVYQKYDSFTERFEDTLEALSRSKACCCSLFSVSDFAGRLAWNPRREFNRKATNHCLNSQKAVFQHDGNKYGKKEVPTAFAERLRQGVKKRKRPSERAKVAERLIPQARTPGSDQQTQGESSSRPAPHAQTPHVSTHPTPALSKSTPPQPQVVMGEQESLGPHAYPSPSVTPGPPALPQLPTYQQPQGLQQQPPHHLWFQFPHGPMPEMGRPYQFRHGATPQVAVQQARPQYPFWAANPQGAPMPMGGSLQAPQHQETYPTPPEANPSPEQNWYSHGENDDDMDLDEFIETDKFY
ncbi:hypothetical protein GGR51DRAFT_574885 [Nemania sp. FL0031]|nr:hypothetical protein GGR51DRAFT_574885 [Nemania sp. FL0031]